MPHSSSAKKRHRQSLERRDRNRAVKHELKTRVRKVVEAVDAGKADDAQGTCGLPPRNSIALPHTRSFIAMPPRGPNRGWPRGSRR